MIITEALRIMADRCTSLSPSEMLELADQVDALNRQVSDLTRRNDQLEAKVGVLTGMSTLSFAAAGSARTIEEIREEVTFEGTNKDSQLYNAFEVRQILYAYKLAEGRCKDLQEAYEEIDVENKPVRSVKQILDALDNATIGPFSFLEITALREHFRPQGLTRPVKKNIKELFDAIRAASEPYFYLSEIRMIRQWGQDHERTADNIKRRFGRAFTDPVGYMDSLPVIISAAEKKEMLSGNLITRHAFPHGVYRRPEAFHVKDWTLFDGVTQFHAGEHFHTRVSDGTWWCGKTFQNLSGADLMGILETALAELRLLYIHYPEGIKNAKA